MRESEVIQSSVIMCNYPDAGVELRAWLQRSNKCLSNHPYIIEQISQDPVSIY